MNTIRLGYLLRKPMAADAWLAFLRRHLPRGENIRIWRFMSDDLRFLEYANHEDALAFFEELLERYPSYLLSLEGFRILAWNYRWLPAEFTHRAMKLVLESSWSYKEQAVGELVMLLHMLKPDDQHIAELHKSALGPSPLASAQFKLGIIWSAAEQWNDPSFRAICTSTITSILPTAEEEVGHAAFNLFRGTKNKIYDHYFAAVLEALGQNPALLKRQVSFLVDRLKEGLRDGLSPSIVLKLTRLIIEQNHDVLADMRTGWGGDTGDIIDILLTLQRFEATRLESTNLFEILMDLGVYEMGRSLKELDRRI